MSKLVIRAGDFTFDARFEEQAAPKTVAAFRKALPFESHIIHVRWSGEGVWMPLGDLDFGVGYENHTSYPAPGQIILYPGGISETEILMAYGGVHFASKMGQLAGNHFITVTSGLENLATLGSPGRSSARSHDRRSHARGAVWWCRDPTELPLDHHLRRHRTGREILFSHRGGPQGHESFKQTLLMIASVLTF